MILTGWGAIWESVVVGVLAYAGLIVWLRATGKRTVSKWNAFDSVVSFALGSMLATLTVSRATALRKAW